MPSVTPTYSYRTATGLNITDTYSSVAATSGTWTADSSGYLNDLSPGDTTTYQQASAVLTPSSTNAAHWHVWGLATFTQSVNITAYDFTFNLVVTDNLTSDPAIISQNWYIAGTNDGTTWTLIASGTNSGTTGTRIQGACNVNYQYVVAGYTDSLLNAPGDPFTGNARLSDFRLTATSSGTTGTRPNPPTIHAVGIVVGANYLTNLGGNPAINISN